MTALRTLAPAAALTVLAGCAAAGPAGWPEHTGGTPPDAALSAVVGRADLDAGPRFHPVALSGGPGVVHVLGEFPFDVDSEEPPPPPDLLLSYPVVDGQLGEPVVFTEREDYPGVTGAWDSGLATAADGDALLLVELADDEDRQSPGIGQLALIRLDPSTGQGTTTPLAVTPVDRPYESLSDPTLDCSVDDVCAAMVSDGYWGTLLLVLDAHTGEVLASTPVAEGDDRAVDGALIDDDGARIAVLGSDRVVQGSAYAELPWVQYYDTALVPLGPQVPLSAGDASVGGAALRHDGSLVAAVRAEPKGSAALVGVTPGAGSPALLTGPLPGIGAVSGLVVDDLGGWVHLLAPVAPAAPAAVSVDLTSGEVHGSGRLCAGDATLEGLVLTAAGAVTVGACDGAELTVLGGG